MASLPVYEVGRGDGYSLQDSVLVGVGGLEALCIPQANRQIRSEWRERSWKPS